VLLRQILGLLSPSRGTVTVDGRPSREVISGELAASQVGMLFQQGALYSAFNVLDNIAFALREQGTLPDAVVRDAAMVKLQMVGLKPEHASRMPADLSGGMIKRVALARALMMDPPLLLLDEPTAGLDPKGSDEFCELLRDIHAELGLTVIMVTHDLDTLFALSTRVAVLAEKKCCSPEPARCGPDQAPVYRTFLPGRAWPPCHGPGARRHGRRGKLMENKSHAMAAGIFVLVVAALLAGLAVWLTRDNREYQLYEMSTKDGVSGLQPQATVRYKGVPVGKVVRIGFDPQIPGNVLIRIAVGEDTPVTPATYAQLGYQG
jgi:ABC-type transporter Mla maintaining outer membrane lipid asymmetry ATPase subunit MlaF